MQLPAGGVQGLLSGHRELPERGQSQERKLFGEVHKVLPEAGNELWLVNPRHACARVTVLVLCVCVCVYPSVCLFPV